jgi:hypothetical protein
MERSEKCLSYYLINIGLTYGYLSKLKYLKRDKSEDIGQRLNRALKTCGYEEPKPPEVVSDFHGVGIAFPKRRLAEITVQADGFADPGFRPGTLIEALKTEFGDVMKGDVKIVRNIVALDA